MDGCHDDASDWEWLLFQQSGVVATHQAVAHLGRGKVRHLVARKQWRRICRGVLLTYDGPQTTAQHLWVAVLAAGGGAVLAGLVAAIDGGLRGLRAERLDVLVHATHGYGDLLRRMPIDMPAVFVHRTRFLPRHHLQAGLPARTTMARSVVDAAAWARTDTRARQVLAAACQQRRVSPDELLGLVAERPTLPRRQLMIETLGDLAGGTRRTGPIGRGGCWGAGGECPRERSLSPA